MEFCEEYNNRIHNHPYIYAWHKGSSYDPYILSLLRKADEENAPIDAVYHDTNRGWVRLRDCAESTIVTVVRRLPHIECGTND